MKAATIMVTAEEGSAGKAAGNADRDGANSPARTDCQRYYMDHMPLSAVEDVVDSEQYAAVCKARLHISFAVMDTCASVC